MASSASSSPARALEDEAMATTAAAANCEAKICEPGGSGLFLPAFRGLGEQDLPNELRAVMYLCGLLWMFMGVALVSDIFMGAIERITSKKRRILEKSTGRMVTVKVWNDTVANLTLMALGSSAPEILLSVIELVLMPPMMMSGALGPSTIVGSAAFNLFCITAVCVSAIPSGEVRYIKDMQVFAITATFSIVAYFWLVIIVQLSSPNIIEIWEGAVTLLMFPVLVYLAYLADVGYFADKFRRARSTILKVDVPEMSKDELAALALQVNEQHGGQLSDEQLLTLIRKETSFRKTRGHYRVGAIRQMFGGKRLVLSHGGSTTAKHGFSSILPAQDGDGTDERLADVFKAKPVFLSFCSGIFAVLENIGTVELAVTRFGDVEQRVRVDYATRDGSAQEGSDYHAEKGTLEFGPGEAKRTIGIRIIDDSAWEDDEEFYVDLSNPRAVDEGMALAQLGENSTARIIIIDDDHPGTLSFATEDGLDEMTVQQGSARMTHTITVKRTAGCNGAVTCRYCTEEASAIKDVDFVQAEGELTFAAGQLEASFEITTLPRSRYESLQEFRVVLSDPSNGASFDVARDGGSDTQILTIVIASDSAVKDRIDALMKIMQVDYARQSVAYSNWRDQFRSALLVNGGGDDEGDEEPPSCIDKVMHIVTIFWKLLFACIPPADYLGGWLCFVCSLLMIGVVTALIGDLASLLGCVVGMADSATAITLVALGTSLPDTFASKAAAEQDAYADASIGNITGSNSVNVFLGLGLPWLIGAVYWHAVGRTPEWQEQYRLDPSSRGYFQEWNQGEGKFIVIGDDLNFSVMVFVSCAVVCFVVLLFRRALFGGELGGPKAAKHVTSALLVLLWFAYVAASIANSASPAASDAATSLPPCR